MKRSLNEIEHACRKAAHGCGLPWGVADEVGKAVRWLHVYEIDGVSTLISLLQKLDHHHAGRFTPTSLDSPWVSESEVLSPLLTGVCLSDCMDILPSTVIEAYNVAHPVLTAGFLGQTALSPNQTVCIEWASIKLVLHRDCLVIEGDRINLLAERAEKLTCTGTSAPDPALALAPHIGDATVSPRSWDAMEQYAHLTYVKATEESRLSGAGAGLTDND